MAHRYPTVANPIKMSETPPLYHSAPPALGEHTHSVLENLLGLSDEDIKNLQGQNII